MAVSIQLYSLALVRWSEEDGEAVAGADDVDCFLYLVNASFTSLTADCR